MRLCRKRQQIANVTAVSVRNDTVSSVEPSQLANIAAHLLEIDLQDNLLWRWEEVSRPSPITLPTYLSDSLRFD